MARQALVSFDAVLCVVLLFCDVGCALCCGCVLDYTAATRGDRMEPRAALFFVQGRVRAVFFFRSVLCWAVFGPCSFFVQAGCGPCSFSFKAVVLFCYLILF